MGNRLEKRMSLKAMIHCGERKRGFNSFKRRGYVKSGSQTILTVVYQPYTHVY
jgi:hypothetical protein